MMSSKDWKFSAGIVLLAASCLVPFLGFWVASLDMPIALKGTIIGLLTVGAPEVLAVAAVALLGKPAFELIASKASSIARQLVPQGSVGRTRYTIGLVLFVITFVPNYVMGYAPQLLPDASPFRLYINIASDTLFVVSLFVLGGDFWDKLRALFIYDARASFPDVQQVD